MTPTRRNILIGGAIAIVASGTAFMLTGQSFEGDKMTVQQAHVAATAGEVLLIDIRRPDEWVRTGVGEGANPLDMRRDDFVTALDALAKGDRARPIALICARGVRSRRMSQRLTDAGFTRIIDVPEGMLGSRAGPGWVKSGLPVAAPET